MGAKGGSWIGNTFFHPALDYLCVGGVLSFSAIFFAPDVEGASVQSFLPLIAFFLNIAHFSASTVRLYSKNGSFQDHSFLTMVLPLIVLVGVSVAVYFSDIAGRPLNALYMTWSPFHYSMQAYGLSVIYAHRSGLNLGRRESHWLKAASLAPFAMTLFPLIPSNGFVDFFISPYQAIENLQLYETYLACRRFLSAFTVLFPIILAGVWHRKNRKRFPLLIPVILVSNAVWLSIVVTSYSRYWPYVSAAHGLQYLYVVTYFHSLEKGGGGRPQRWRQSLYFYGWCLIVSYALWRCWPYAYQWLGIGYAESLVLIIAAINIHHFIVDAYIWGIRSDKAVRRTMLS